MANIKFNITLTIRSLSYLAPSVLSGKSNYKPHVIFGTWCC